MPGAQQERKWVTILTGLIKPGYQEIVGLLPKTGSKACIWPQADPLDISWKSPVKFWQQIGKFSKNGVLYPGA